MKTKLRRIKRYLQNNKWEVIFYTVSILFVLEVFVGAYNYYKAYYYSNEIDTLQTKIDKSKDKLDGWKSENDYKKYKLVKNIEEKTDSISWNSTINSLISIFNRLKTLEKGEKSIVLQDFKVEMDSINVKGKTYSMESVYKSGGIIDRFRNLNFIKSFSIPFYKKQGDSYNFSLDANISTNE